MNDVLESFVWCLIFALFVLVCWWCLIHKDYP